jgi:predicted type IV restriction endonuclease
MEQEKTTSAQETNTVPIQEAKKPAERQGPKWEVETRERLRIIIRKFIKPLQDLVSRDANEGDTRLLVTDFLCEVLGYDKYSDLTTEYQVKGEFADYGVRIDKQLVAFIEVKRITTKLDVKHLRQVEMYAVNEGVEWVILTNAQQWQVYHLTGALPVQIDLALDINLLSEDSIPQKTHQMFFLAREAFKRHLIDELWKAKRAMSPKSLTKVICAEPVIDCIRKELKRQTGYSTDAKEICTVIKQTLLRSECFEKDPKAQ